MKNLKIKVLSALQQVLPMPDLIKVLINEENTFTFKWRNSKFRIYLSNSYQVTEIEGVFSHSTDKSMILDKLIEQTIQLQNYGKSNR